jgi:hypothetical protein
MTESSYSNNTLIEELKLTGGGRTAGQVRLGQARSGSVWLGLKTEPYKMRSRQQRAVVGRGL